MDKSFKTRGIVLNSFCNLSKCILAVDTHFSREIAFFVFVDSYQHSDISSFLIGFVKKGLQFLLRGMFFFKLGTVNKVTKNLKPSWNHFFKLSMNFRAPVRVVKFFKLACQKLG